MSKETTKQYEGLRLVVYDDATGWPITSGHVVKGNPSIGWGINLTVPISEAAAEFLFNERYGHAEEDIDTMFPRATTPDLTDNRRDALVDMRYQMGPSRFRKFVRMISAVHWGVWDTVADECLNSDYGRAHPRRAGDNAAALREG